jgi:hypothetical protein
MIATLLVLCALQSSPVDVPRLDAPGPRALSLLSPEAAAPRPYGFLDHEHEHVPGTPARSSAFSVLRVTGEFLAGFGTQLLVGSGMWAVEVVGLFGAAYLTASAGGVNTELLFSTGARAMVLVNGTLLPLLGALPVWLIASTALEYSHHFVWTWLSGVAAYSVFWAVQLSQPSRYGGLESILWPTHAASWLLTTLVQILVVNLTEEPRFRVSRAPSSALLNVEGKRLSWGAPLPMIAPDVSRPGRVVPVFSLAGGRF